MRISFDEIKDNLINIVKRTNDKEIIKMLNDAINGIDLNVDEIEDRIGNIQGMLEDLRYNISDVESLLDIDVNGDIDKRFQVILVMIDEIKSGLKYIVE